MSHRRPGDFGGEPPSDSLEAAEHWAAVYGELLTFEESLLRRLQMLLPTLPQAARHEAELTDLPAITADIQTFRRRHAFWREEVLRLRGG